jgi:hypothetical protein
MYVLPDGNAFDCSVEVYNFDDKSQAKVTVEAVPPAGWTVEDAKRQVTVDPMGRETLAFKVRPGRATLDRCRLIVRAKSGKRRVAPCICNFTFDPALVTPLRCEPMDWTDPARWRRLTSPNGMLSLGNTQPGVLHFDASFEGKSDRWAYPTLTFEKPMDMSGFDGIAVNLSASQGDPASSVRLMLVEPNGAYYTGLTHAKNEKRRVVFLFRDMERVGVSPPDPNGHLDLDAISAVRIGCNITRGQPGRMVLDWSDFELVKL